MRFIFSGLCILSVVAVFVVAASLAQADTISGPFTTTTPIPDTLTDWTGSLSFPKFDPSLGTLTEVDLALSGRMSTILTVINSSPTGSSGHANTHLQMTVQDAGGNLIIPEIDIYSASYTYSLGAGESVTSGALIKTGASDDQYFDSGVLAEFTGLGAIVLPASTFTETVIANTGGNTAASQVTQARLTGTVTYHYNPVLTPEPSTLMLFGIGAMGLLAYAWRKRA
jgi:hypothetical protein